MFTLRKSICGSWLHISILYLCMGMCQHLYQFPGLSVFSQSPAPTAYTPSHQGRPVSGTFCLGFLYLGCIFHFWCGIQPMLMDLESQESPEDPPPQNLYLGERASFWALAGSGVLESSVQPHKRGENTDLGVGGLSLLCVWSWPGQFCHGKKDTCIWGFSMHTQELLLIWWRPFREGIISRH